MHSSTSSQASRFGSYRLLTPILAKYRYQIFLALIALLLASTFTLALPVLVNDIVSAATAGNINLMQENFIYILACALCLGLATALRFYMVSWLGERVIADLRKRLFTHLLMLPNSFYDQTQSGELLSRLTTDTTLVERVVGTSVSMALRSSILLIGALIMLAITSLELTLLVSVVTPIVIIPVIYFSRKYRAFSKESQSYTADASAFASQVLSLIDTTKSYRYEQKATQYFNQVIETGFGVSKQRIYARSCLTLLIIFLMISAIVAIMWKGTLEVIGPSPTLTSGELGQFFAFAIYVATCVASLSEVWGDLMRASGALSRIIDLLDEKEQIDKGSEHVANYDICFEEVTFSYPHREHCLILNHIGFTAKPGQVTALVGVSGAGKSTIFKLLMRNYQPQSGQIRLGGVDINDIEVDALRSSISLVSHEAGIFPTSIRENICLGESYTDQQIEHATKQASISEFIEHLPEGYDTKLGEKGVLLSEGQRQRIALARAIIRDAPIILLDEATNALDAITEEAINHAMSDVFKDKTVLVIAHRLATVAKANQIIVIDHGEIEAIGTHKSLCKSSEIYTKLASIQLLV